MISFTQFQKDVIYVRQLHNIILVRSESAEFAKQQSVFHRNPNVYVYICKWSTNVRKLESTGKVTVLSTGLKLSLTDSGPR